MATMRRLAASLLLLAGCGAPLKLVRPESALWDAATDTYLVSNIGENPFDADGDGFIARFVPDGKSEKWIGGLNAPRGMALVGDRLWVADLTVLRSFDRKTGKPVRRSRSPARSCSTTSPGMGTRCS
jgi:hypothetical protein